MLKIYAYISKITNKVPFINTSYLFYILFKTLFVLLMDNILQLSYLLRIIFKL